MSSSKPPPRQVPPPPNSRAGNPYTRFIPREELQGFAAWTPGNLPGAPGGVERRSGDRRTGAQPAPPGAAAAPPQAPEEALRQQVHAARQAGYQEGYRDGLVALESFKQAYASQVTTQFGRLLASFSDELDALELQIAEGVARTAAQLARQVVRSELAQRPDLVAQVAADAVHAVLASAQHITVSVHPDDHALVAEGAAEALAARGARLVAQPDIERGGCLVQSDAGRIDARIAVRWQQAAQALANGVDWPDDGAGTPESGT